MIHTRHYRIHDVVPYINWLYFFHSWGFPSRYSSISKVHGCVACRQNWLQAFPADERVRASEAMRLYDEALALLRHWDEQGFQTTFRAGIFEANADGDDILLHTPSVRIPLLRQQHSDKGKPCLCLSDFVRPLSSGIRDTVGLFVSTVPIALTSTSTAGTTEEPFLEAGFLADRLAEATAELGHLHTRREFWGYAPDESLTIEELFQEKYQGKRPAIGYPNLPDQSLCFLLSQLLDFPSIGVTLTENGAMQPHASTCGLLLSHPATCHFSVGKVGEDQFLDYASRHFLPVHRLSRFMRL